MISVSLLVIIEKRQIHIIGERCLIVHFSATSSLLSMIQSPSSLEFGRLSYDLHQGIQGSYFHIRVLFAKARARPYTHILLVQGLTKNTSQEGY